LLFVCFELLPSCSHDRSHRFKNYRLFFEQFQKVFSLDLDQDTFALIDDTGQTSFTRAQCYVAKGVIWLLLGDAATWKLLGWLAFA